MVIDKSSSRWRSKEWANEVLRIAIAQLYNSGRVLEARRAEVFYWLHDLEAEGFVWQSTRLRNHIHLAIKKGVFSFTAPAGADSQPRVEEAS